MITIKGRLNILGHVVSIVPIAIWTRMRTAFSCFKNASNGLNVVVKKLKYYNPVFDIYLYKFGVLPIHDKALNAGSIIAGAKERASAGFIVSLLIT